MQTAQKEEGARREGGEVKRYKAEVDNSPFRTERKRKKEGKKEGHNERERSAGRGRCRRLLLRAHNGHKGARLFYTVISV